MRDLKGTLNNLAHAVGPLLAAGLMYLRSSNAAWAAAMVPLVVFLQSQIAAAGFTPGDGTASFGTASADDSILHP